MDIVANLAGMQRNVKFNSTKQFSNNNLIFGDNTLKRDFKKTFDLSKKEISKEDSCKKDVSNLDKDRKEKKEISKLDSKGKRELKSMSKGKNLNSKKDSVKLNDEFKETEEVRNSLMNSEKELEFLNEDNNLEQDEMLASLIEKFSELISQFTSKTKEEVMGTLSEKINGLESVDDLFGEEIAIKNFVLSECIGEDNPLFASEEDVKMIKELMEKVEKLLSGEDISKAESDEDVPELLLSEVRSEELMVNKDKIIGDKAESSIVVEEKSDDEPKIKVLDMRQDKGMQGNDNTKNTFVQIIGEKTLEASAETFELRQTQKVNPVDLIEQIVTKAKVILEDNKSTMIMKLNPEHLGKVAIKLISENGSLKGTFTVENQLVKEALESNMISLKQQLEDSGIKVDKIEVSLSSSNEDSNYNEQESNNQQFNKRNKNRNRLNVIDESGSSAIMDEEELLGDSLVNFSA